MIGLGSWNTPTILKIPNYLKTCPTRYPGAQSASLHPELPQGLSRSTAAAAQGSISSEAAGKCPCCCLCQYSWQEPVCSWQYLDFPIAQMVKNLPAMKEIRVQSLGREDPLEKGMAIHSSILAWRIPWAEKPGGLQSMRWKRVGHDWATNARMHDLNVWLTWFYLR